jgi:purine-binding chemotaxis protein CheW
MSEPRKRATGKKRKLDEQPVPAVPAAETEQEAAVSAAVPEHTDRGYAASQADDITQGVLEVEATEQIGLDDALQLVTFMVAAEEYGFPIMRVQEVLRSRYVHVTAIPNAPLFVDGVMNLRGRVIPVISLRSRFCMERGTPGPTGRIVVVEVSGRVIGVSVDAVVEVATVDASKIEPLPELAATERSQFIVGVSRTGGRMVIVLDMDRVFSVEEKIAMDELVTGKREEAPCA